MIDLSTIPTQVRCDCDPKLLNGEFKNMLSYHGIKLAAVPNGRQN